MIAVLYPDGLLYRYMYRHYHYMYRQCHYLYTQYTGLFRVHTVPGADPGGGAPGARPPKIGKNMIFLRKIVIFHTKYPKYFRASLRSARFF